MRRHLFSVTVVLLLVGVGLAFTQQRLPAEAADDMVARIRAEGLQRSRAMAMYRTLTDEIGARLTGSPAHKRAANWARDRFAEFGLANPHLEPYEFGRGWELEQMSVAMTEPRYFPLIAYAEAWTPSTKGVITGRARPTLGPLPSTAEIGRVVTSLNHGLLRSAFAGQANAVLVGGGLRIRDEHRVVLNPWRFRRAQARPSR